MEYEEIKEITLGEIGTTLAAEGVGTAGGFIGAAFIGRQLQNVFIPDNKITTLQDKIIAWFANNAPKLAGWYLLRRFVVPPYKEIKPGTFGSALLDLNKAFAGSVIFDTVMRLANDGRNPATAKIWGWQILGEEAEVKGMQSLRNDNQRLIQENTVLRQEINKALQKLAALPAPVPKVVSSEVEERERRFGFTASPEAEEAERRRRQYGSMQYEITPPAVREREKKYGFMGNEENVASMFGML